MYGLELYLDKWDSDMQSKIGAAPSHLVPSRPSFDRPEGDEYIENRQYDRRRGDAQMWRHGSIEDGDDGRSVISR